MFNKRLLPQNQEDAMTFVAQVVADAGYDDQDKDNLLLALAELMQVVHRSNSAYIDPKVLKEAFLRAKANNTIFKILEEARKSRMQEKAKNGPEASAEVVSKA